ncbi:MAG: c-type cytochrome [Zoogloeaceae bacterium]|nr:c-type cytochrome [Zoogloeaceae bacterium]
MNHFSFKQTTFGLLLSALVLPVSADAGKPISEKMPVMTPELKQRLAKADLDAGARFFERKCSQCHDGEKSGGHFKGPHLWNVFGRKAGTSPGFDYSPAMKASGHTWNYATLDYYLADTEQAVPGRSMNFTRIDDPELRASVVMYLRRFNDPVPPLPQ